MLPISEINTGRIYVTADDRIVKCFSIGMNCNGGDRCAFITDAESNMKCEREDGVLRNASMAEERDYYKAAYKAALKEWENAEKKSKNSR